MGDVPIGERAIPYLGVGCAGLGKEEDSLLAYLALSVGPLNRDMSTMIAHLHGIWHFHKVKMGPNPISNMPRAQLMVRGMRREKGDTASKLPFTEQDMEMLESVLGLTTTDP